MLNFKELIDQYAIKIPMIQRDYAQGRNDGDAVRVRKDLLSKIHERLDSNNSLHLDFVYGTIKQKCFIPLDGQQRLTTLFLLYWYFGKKTSEDIEYLTKFTYETRNSSREFCRKSVNCEIDFSKSILSDQIKNANWFLPFWNNDPTIKAMLTMLDAIDEKFKGENYFDRLGNITIEFFELEKFNLSEDLYIKMNARGKGLTRFEVFKAQFEEFLDDSHCDSSMKNERGEAVSFKEYFAEMIDGKWLDFFWKNRNDQEVGTGMLRYIYFVTEFLYFKSVDESITTNPFEYDKNNVPVVDMDKVRLVFQSQENTLFLFGSLNFLCKIDKPDDYFSSLFSNQYKDDMVALFDKNVNLVDSCITGNSFDIRAKILLFTILEYSLKFNEFVVSDNLKNILRITNCQKQ